MGAAGVNAPTDFELAKHVFDFVPAFIERLVERNLQFSVGLWRDAWGDASFQQRIAEPVGVVSFVSERGFGVTNGFKHEGCALEVTHLAFGKQQNQRTACSIAYSMKLGVQSVLCASDTSGYRPFFKRLAAVRWALRWVASIIS